MRRFLYIGILGVVVAIAAIVLTYWSGENPVPEPKLAVEGSGTVTSGDRNARGTGIPVPPPPPVAAFRPGADQPDTKPPLTSDKPVITSSSKPPETVVKKPTEEKPSQTATASLPAFDVVRVNPEGDALIAGRAEPGTKVGIYDGDVLRGTVVADGRGEWVFLPTEPLPSGQRELSLARIEEDGSEIRSGSAVVLAVPDRQLALSPALKKSKPKEASPEGVLAVLVSRDATVPSRVLQKPSEDRGIGDAALSIDVIDYDDSGNVSIGGKGLPGLTVRVYVDNSLAGGDVVVSPEGNWQVSPGSDIGPGVHKLRVDGLKDGSVVARVEMPFSRAETPTATASEVLIVVQPGNSLWRIARGTLGSGFRYTEIYAANQSKIIDPDLIFPGQVFSMPVAN